MTNYNDGLWHGWNGGECPVHGKSKVKWATEDGFHGESPAENIDWAQGTNLVAFRVIKEHKEPREFWIMNGTQYGAEVHAVHARAKSQELYECEIIHVREVLK